LVFIKSIHMQFTTTVTPRAALSRSELNRGF
jgi:hypothetical protein